MRTTLRIAVLFLATTPLAGCAWLFIGGAAFGVGVLLQEDRVQESKKDRTPPVVALVAPQGGEVWSGTKRITWTTHEENPNSASIELSGDSGASWAAVATAIADVGYYDWDTTQHTDGQTYLVRVMARDREGNASSWASASSTFKLDNTPPSVSITSPIGNEVWAGAKSITWITTDANSSTADVDLSSNHGYLWGSIAHAIPDTGSLPWDTRTQPDLAYYRARVRATDLAGNTSAWSFSSSDFVVDNTSPVVTLTAPTGGEVWSGTHSVAWVTADANPETVLVEVSTDSGGSWATLASAAADTGTYSLDTTSQPPGGRNRIRVKATDKAGNVSNPVSSPADFSIMCYSWVKRIGGTGGDRAHGISVDNSGNLFTTGYFAGTVDFRADWGGGSDPKSTASTALFLTKVASDGTYGLTRMIEGTIPYSIAADGNASIYITGGLYSTVDFRADWGGGSDTKTVSGTSDAFVTKVNADGTYGWTRRIGGSGEDRGSGIAIDASGNVFLIGYFEGTVDFAADWGASNSKTCSGYKDVFVTKINANGSYGWTRIVGDYGDDRGVAVACDLSGNLFAAGTFGGASFDFRRDWGGGTDIKTCAGFSDVFITKIVSDGSYGWTKSIGGTGGDWPCANGLAIDSAGNIFISGQFVNAVDFHADWGAPSDGRNSAGGVDCFVTRINGDGSYGWSRRWGGTGNDWSEAVAWDSTGTIFMTGIFEGTVNFRADWGGSETKTAAGPDDAYILMMRDDGSYGKSWRIGGSFSTGANAGLDVSVDSSGFKYIAGCFYNTVDFREDWPGGSDPRTAAGDCDAFIMKFR